MNRTTREALLPAHRLGLRVTRRGPYEIDGGLFRRALRQIDLLEGRVPGRKVLARSGPLRGADRRGAREVAASRAPVSCPSIRSRG